MIILKLLSVFKTGQTIGFPSYFTIAKSYFMFNWGLGNGIPHLCNFFNEESKKTQMAIFSGFMVLGPLIFYMPFRVYFRDDRSEQLAQYGIIENT